MRRLAPVLLAALGCTSATLAPPQARTRLGPARSAPIERVVALRATCGALTSMQIRRQEDGTRDSTIASSAIECPEQQVAGVDAAIRAFLEFRGYRVIDSERVNATTLSRIETETRQRSGTYESSLSRIELRGTRFEDATPAMQDRILAELGADALLDTRIWIGAGKGASGRRDVEVLVRLLHVASGELAWAARCRVEAGMVTNQQPMMDAARCAVEAVGER